ncbi:aldehyde dehydrogenase [Pseudonocardia kujensis]|uniref:aldehyde dehydrogenase n=1 Tax=Pseudonocardia kujensis TaxID=1128675 RepID=UPI001E2A2BE6|nr:aldehyde dehydrogenase [Pseudonocardia kujensis]MCE0764086.1 aldehyde dehydrogenase [Pseudonocardia kujensis]
MHVVGLVIDGRVNAVGGRGVYPSHDPYRGEPWATVADAGDDDVDRAVRSSRAAFAAWSVVPAPERGRLLTAFADAVVADAKLLAEMETRDTGKLLREMRGQIDALPEWFRYFGGLADKVGGEVLSTGKPDYFVYTTEVPVGVVAAVTSWNSPALLLAWKLAPALAAGCTVVAKPSEYSPASAVRLAEIALEVGFPPGVFNVITGSGAAAGEALVRHPDVDKIAFTGSVGVGRQVAHVAADRMARTTLELGGKSAQLVFDDADLTAATNGVLAGIFAASGQSCMAGSRLLVQRSVAAELVSRLVDRATSIRMGDPMDPATEMGPLANPAQFEKVIGYLDTARAEGVEVLAGGGPRESLGKLFFEPTILRHDDTRSALWREEIFGPVLSVLPFDDEAEAIELANGTSFGLAAGLWTQDLSRVHSVVAALRAGSVWVNAYRTVAPQVPFGGIGISGIGRESGRRAMDTYRETKAVWTETTGASRDPFVLG